MGAEGGGRAISSRIPDEGVPQGLQSPIVHLAWFGLGLAVSFLIPYVLSSLLDLQHDLYYLLYFALILPFLYSYVRWGKVDLAELFSRRWVWSLGLGVLAVVFLVANVLSRDSTDGPSGAYLVFELLWRGGAYGIVDALLLTAFPGLVAFGLLASRLDSIQRKAGYVGLAAVLVLIITGVYHLGYDQYREDGIVAPETGNIIISVPMLATINPVGSVLAHASMHIAAEAHSHETDVFLPPQVEAD